MKREIVILSFSEYNSWKNLITNSYKKSHSRYCITVYCTANLSFTVIFYLVALKYLSVIGNMLLISESSQTRKQKQTMNRYAEKSNGSYKKRTRLGDNNIDT